MTPQMKDIEHQRKKIPTFEVEADYEWLCENGSEIALIYGIKDRYTLYEVGELHPLMQTAVGWVPYKSGHPSGDGDRGWFAIIPTKHEKSFRKRFPNSWSLGDESVNAVSCPQCRHQFVIDA